jgi:CheY-like chemotaxis protein
MKKIRIIIVENDEDEQLFMKEGFSASGDFEILSFFRSGEELLEDLNERQNDLPDMILSDLNMPGKNGYDILNEVKNDKRFGHIPIIITSTSSIKLVIDNCIKLGATAFIQKPDTFVEYEQYAKDLAKWIQ